MGKIGSKAALAERLADKICSFSERDITPKSLELSRTAILDTIAVSLAGISEPCCQILLGTPGVAETAGPCLIFGTDKRTSALDASLINGVAAHALDYDDVNQAMSGHHSAPLVGPIFVMDYPASICPLTKRKTSNPRVAERFELFVHGMEVANAYTELNDPYLQEELFSGQLAGQKEEDSMAKMDHDFIRALKHGMPPAGGLGIGIDRLVMLLTNAQTIRDIILFPLLRHETV